MTPLRLTLRLVLYPIAFLLGLAAIGFALAIIVFVLLYPNLPSLDVLTDYRPKIPLRVYSADGRLIGEFGEERRSVVKISDVPALMKQAILAAEDDRFYQHPGIDTTGLLRAAATNLVRGGKKQGASTITQQVARNFFLSSEKTYTRKLYEILLSFKIENNLSKDQIFELYVNQIFLGQRAYGFAAAARIYYGKDLEDLSIAEAAMLAGLPKAPSSFNPVINPKRARIRQLYVLKRMLDLDFITDQQYENAKNEPLTVKRDLGGYAAHAEYVAEMARQIAAERFPEESYPRDFIYTHGLRIHTTINYEEQEAAYQSVRKGIMEYDRRHGFRGAESYVDMAEISSDQDEDLDVLLGKIPQIGDLIPALVLSSNPQQVRVYPLGGEIIQFTGAQLKWVARMLDDKAPPNKRLKRGAIIRIQKDEKNQWQIVQIPEVESAFSAMNPETGAIRALVGGFDFNRNKFNHVTQAWRQPGSSFKPFIYSAALEKGFGPSSTIADEPITIPGSLTGGAAWTPHNYDNKYEGPMMMRRALAKSKNMVSIRLLQAIGPQFAQDYAGRFGLDPEKHPAYLTMALGAGSVTPWQMTNAYAVFANGGFRVQPFIVSSIRDERGNVLAAMPPPPPADEAMRAIDARNAYLMDSMLRDVTIYGTAARASVALKRQDLAGKTGTTNDYLDAWFCGYQKTVVACAWVGFDQPKKLGDKETGGAVALPIWIGYMKTALQKTPVATPQIPEGLIQTASGDWRYAENDHAKRIRLDGEEAQDEPEDASPPPKPELDKPPSD